ncbi:MAG: type II/IV secretion system ATPase subunit [Halobacteriales archaeon]|nr:type II/IV secretion system ATPase subunit [Halobacteriales archaeon]
MQVAEMPVDATSEIPDVGSREEVVEELKEYFETTEETYPWGDPSDEFLEESFFDFSYLDEHEEVERYWVNKPFAYVSILRDEKKRDETYYVVEPTMDEFEEFASGDLTEILRDVITYVDVEEGEDRAEKFKKVSEELIHEYSGGMSDGSLHKIQYYLRRDFAEHGKIDAIMRDRNIEDISCDGTGVPVYVYHRNYRDLMTNVAFDKGSVLNSFIVRMAQKSGCHISVSNPLVDTSLPDGSRVQLTLGDDISTRGSNFTIRKFADVPITPVDLIRWNTFSLDEMAYFWLCIENNKSLVFAGGTASGKTTSMNAVSFFIPPKSKVVSIEDTREIKLPHDNWIQSVTRQPFAAGERGDVDMYDLLQAALRQRPEHILVGEIRAQPEVALTFFQALATGHTSYTTFHADSVDSLIDRLENDPLNVPRRMVQALDIVSVQKQIVHGGKRVRRNSEIVEIGDSGTGDSIRTKSVFKWDAATDEHRKLAEPSLLQDIARTNGWGEERLKEELRRRREVLEFLVGDETTDHEKVGSMIHMFWHDQDWVVEGIRDGTLDTDEVQEIEEAIIQEEEEVVADGN